LDTTDPALAPVASKEPEKGKNYFGLYLLVGGRKPAATIIVAAAPLMGCEIAAFAPKADESSDYQASTDRYLACNHS
jgi:hypothetical protein